MEYKTYVCRKRARFKAICGQVNIPYGTTLNGQGGFLILNDLPVQGKGRTSEPDHRNADEADPRTQRPMGENLG